MFIKYLLPTLLVLVHLPSAAHSADKPHLYLNPALGFDVEGYNYSQPEFPCQFDSVLVEKIIDYAASKGLTVQASSADDKLADAAIPILAIDIEALSLREDYSFGSRSSSNLPSARVAAALIGKRFPEGFVSAKHSCAIATLSEVAPSSSVLDLGTYGVTVCSATHKCLARLARDIVNWAEPLID